MYYQGNEFSAYLMIAVCLGGCAVIIAGLLYNLFSSDKEDNKYENVVIND